jgi:low temperature requirement protein LtrA
MQPSSNLLRHRGEHSDGRVTTVELFFDLVFVFAVTQLSHALLAHLDLQGLAHTALLLMAVWWVWIYTSWATNWLDPQRTPVRLMLFAMMLAGLALSASIPSAFASRGLAFACAYVFMQVGRNLFMLWAVKPHDRSNYENFQRITLWMLLSAVFWIAGGIVDGNSRFGLWIVALFLEYLSPSLGFWVPGLGRSTTAEWKIEGEHIAERCGLFVLIALGESIVVTGATLASLDWSFTTLIAFLVVLTGTVAMWWIYFNKGSEWGSRRISASGDPGRIARLAYTYLHLLLAGGIIVAAVADEIVLRHPLEHTEWKTAAAIVGGPAVYVLGNLLFKRATAGHFALSHMIGLGLFGLTLLAVPVATPLTLAAATAAVLIVVGAWEALNPPGEAEAQPRGAGAPAEG